MQYAILGILFVGYAFGCVIPPHQPPSASGNNAAGELLGMTQYEVDPDSNGAGIRLPRENERDIMGQSSSHDLQERASCARGYTGPMPINRVDTTDRLAELREGMRAGKVVAYVIPTDDSHQSEYVHPCDGRREYISGFSGSAGTAVVTVDEAALWTDGRYFLQAEQELDCNWILMRTGQPGVPSIVQWLAKVLEEGAAVGADPTVMSASAWIDLKNQLEQAKKLQLTSIATNLVDAIWADRPPCSNATIFPLELEFAGKSWQDKVADIRSELTAGGRDAIVISALDEIAWLLNLRGDDIPHTPVFKSYVLMDMDAVFLFVSSRKVTDDVKRHLNASSGCAAGQSCVQLREYDDFFAELAAILFPPPPAPPAYGNVLVPYRYSYSGGASYRIYEVVTANDQRVDLVPSPVLFHQARKNEVEVANIKTCQVRDSATLVEFLQLLESSILAGEDWDEIKAADKLAEMRMAQKNNMGLSFSSISAYGPNGAIIHYSPTVETNTPIKTDNLYLLDSGGQYKDCTTDVTRTVHFGTPTDFQREAYTRVLTGAIDLAMAIFPQGTTDTAIDLAARQNLFQVGLNYRHGTGHGIGMFLGVHESPTQVRIYSTEPHTLEKNQFFSDEPGYYQDGEFGIRLETIVTVVEKKLPFNFDGPYLGLEPVTLVPFEPKLICHELLTAAHKQWLNDYNELTREKVGAELKSRGNSRAHQWLMDRTGKVKAGAPCKLSTGNAASTLTPDRLGAGFVSRIFSVSWLCVAFVLTLSAALI